METGDLLLYQRSNVITDLFDPGMNRAFIIVVCKKIEREKLIQWKTEHNVTNARF